MFVIEDDDLILKKFIVLLF